MPERDIFDLLWQNHLSIEILPDGSPRFTDLWSTNWTEILPYNYERVLSWLDNWNYNDIKRLIPSKYNRIWEFDFRIWDEIIFFRSNWERQYWKLSDLDNQWRYLVKWTENGTTMQKRLDINTYWKRWWKIEDATNRYPQQSNIRGENMESARQLNRLENSEINRFRERLPEEYGNFARIEWVQPTHRMEISWQEFLVSDKITGWGRDIIVGYVRTGDSYEPRLFYYSESWWNWHSTPWQDYAIEINRNWAEEIRPRYNKWEQFGLSYEKWTVVNSEIWEAFWSLQSRHSDIDIMRAFSDADNWYIPSIINNIVPQNFSPNRSENLPYIWRRFWHENPVNQIWWGEPLAEKRRDFKCFDTSQFRDVFRNLDDSMFEFSTMRKIENSPTIQRHENIWRIEGNSNVEVHRYEIKMNWRPVEAQFAHSQSNPNQVWVENILYRDVWINSFWLPKESINAGLFTTKPLEYTTQIPSEIIREIPRQNHIDDYSDIRPFIQDNPLIKAFKNQR